MGKKFLKLITEWITNLKKSGNYDVMLKLIVYVIILQQTYKNNENELGK